MGGRAVIIGQRAVLFLSALLALALAGCHDNDPCGPMERPCKEEGRCTLDGKQCVATDDAICKSSEYCKWEGHCNLRQGKCVAIRPEDCKSSTACSQRGRCGVDADGYCVVGSKEDCEKREECVRGRCELRNGGCVVVREAPTGDNQEGGCPCGCDHSEQMASELMEGSTGDAEIAIEQSLRTIAEREDAGYITWAMVTHRRRLLATSRERLGFVPEGRGVPTPPRPMPDSALRLEGDGLVVRAELMVHGETTEQVRGADKRILASFRLGLEITNASPHARTLSRPEVTGGAGFPVSTWYVLGTDGRPWDGRLEPNQTRMINAVGYLARPLAPGTLAEAEVRLAGLRFPMKDVARPSWR